MNANQIATLSTVRTADRKSQIATLKALRAEGVEVLIKLTASAKAIGDEVTRLLAVAAAAIKSAVSKAGTDIKATLAYWQLSPVKPLNRGERGAIALSLKLGF